MQELIVAQVAGSRCRDCEVTNYMTYSMRTAFFSCSRRKQMAMAQARDRNDVHRHMLLSTTAVVDHSNL